VEETTTQGLHHRHREKRTSTRPRVKKSRIGVEAKRTTKAKNKKNRSHQALISGERNSYRHRALDSRESDNATARVANATPAGTGEKMGKNPSLDGAEEPLRD